jgi:hypothetical protein
MLLSKLLTRSALVSRITPFLVFVLLTSLQGRFGPASAYWFYLAKTIVGLWLLIEVWPLVPEMRWALSVEAVAVGAGVFVMWVGIDKWYPHGFGKTVVENANPNLVFGEHSPLAWFFLGIHLLGMTFVVPPLEEVFFRSFLYRYLANANFLDVPLNRFLPFPFMITALVFGLEHNQWLAGILCGVAYHWLVLRKNRLGDAITAHAITNFLLGAWVIWQGAWSFW